MNLLLDASAVQHGIQLAIAPVFLLTAVAGMISAVAGRLARIIDRARVMEERLRSQSDLAALPRQQIYAELASLRRRGLLANGAIGLLTLCAFMIGLTIIVLFVGETMVFEANRIAIFSFLGGIVSFLMALLCFMAETLLATRLLDFGHRGR